MSVTLIIAAYPSAQRSISYPTVSILGSIAWRNKHEERGEGGGLLNRVSSIPGINLGNRPFGSRSCLSGGDGFNRLIADWLNVCSVRDGNTAGIQLG